MSLPTDDGWHIAPHVRVEEKSGCKRPPVRRLVRVSQNGGREPVVRDGRELFYLEGNKMIALAVKPGQEFSFSADDLFDQPYFHGFGVRAPVLLHRRPAKLRRRKGRAVHHDSRGRQSKCLRRGRPPGIVVVQNWAEELKAIK